MLAFVCDRCSACEYHGPERVTQLGTMLACAQLQQSSRDSGIDESHSSVNDAPTSHTARSRGNCTIQTTQVVRNPEDTHRRPPRCTLDHRGTRFPEHIRDQHADAISPTRPVPVTGVGGTAAEAAAPPWSAMAICTDSRPPAAEAAAPPRSAMAIFTDSRPMAGYLREARNQTPRAQWRGFDDLNNERQQRDRCNGLTCANGNGDRHSRLTTVCIANYPGVARTQRYALRRKRNR